MTISNQELSHSLSLSLQMLIFSALILGTGFLILSPDLASHKETATRADPRPWEVSGGDLTPRLGSGKTTEKDYLSITRLDHGTDDRAIFTRRTNLKAADLPFLEYKITGRNPGTTFYLIWRRQENPQEVFNSRIDWAGDHASVSHLANNPDWQGTITEVGLDVYGDLRQQTPIIEYLSLKPSQPSLMARAVWDEWTVFRNWTQRSAHHLRGTLKPPILSPTMAAAAWAGLALLLLFFVARIKGQSSLTSYIIAVAIPWIALDLLWQSNLSKQLKETKYLFADKTQHEKHMASWEPDLYQYANHLKSKVLPEPGAKIFLLDNEPHRTYRRLRLQYFLLPHNIFNFDKYPRTSSIKPGDYLIALGEIEGLQFNSNAGTLNWHGRALPARLLEESTLASVYQYEGRP
ncbi:MAG: hypothetical protein ABJN62_13210 [Halioglobus sp.]